MMEISPFIVLLTYLIGYSFIIGVVLAVIGAALLIQQRRRPAKTKLGTRRHIVAISFIVLGSILVLYIPLQNHKDDRRFITLQKQKAENITFTIYSFAYLPSLLAEQSPTVHLDQHAKLIDPTTLDTKFMNGPKYSYLLHTFVNDDGHVSIFQFSTKAYNIKPGDCTVYDLEFPDSKTNACSIIGKNATGGDIYSVRRVPNTGHKTSAYITDIQDTRISITGVGEQYEQSLTDEEAVKMLHSAKKASVSQVKFSQ